MRVPRGGLREEGRSTHEGRRSQEHGGGVEGRFGCHIIVGGSCRIHNLDVNECGGAGSIKMRKDQIRDLEVEGTLASGNRRHLPMGAGALGDNAYPAQRSSMWANSSLITLSLTAPWRRSPLRQRTKWRTSVPIGFRLRNGWKEHDWQRVCQRDVEGNRVNQQHKPFLT